MRCRCWRRAPGRRWRPRAHGDADLVLVHDPEAEQKFIAEGHGIAPRQIAWNDFIVVGPAADPAHVKGGHDAVAALKAIAGGRGALCLARRQAAAPTRSNSGCGGRPRSIRQERRRFVVPRYRRRHGAGAQRGLGDARPTRCPTAALGSASATRASWWSLVEGDPKLLNRYDVILLEPGKASRRQAASRRTVSPNGSPRPKARRRSAPTRSSGEQLFHPSAAAPK